MVTLILILLALGVGVIGGATWYRLEVLRRLRTIQPLIVNVLNSLITKMVTEEMTEEEIMKHLEDELNFIDIVLDKKGSPK